ncbi:MAG: phosphoribosylformylglycinamidine synthase I [Elusimicrobiales bacterium]
MSKAKVLVVRAPGTNCDCETADSFRHLGAAAQAVVIGDIVSGKTAFSDFDIAAFPGGFSYGDYIAAGRIHAAALDKVRGELERFIKSGRPVIGICNGFQILVKAGLLPFAGGQSASFTFNDNGRFTARWVRLKVNPKSRCLFTQNLPAEIDLPIAHGEGKFVTRSAAVLSEIRAGHCAALQYVENPNGAQDDIAGLCNPEGNCFGLMPHPERFAFPFQHPGWRKNRSSRADGMDILANAVRYVN